MNSHSSAPSSGTRARHDKQGGEASNGKGLHIVARDPEQIGKNRLRAIVARNDGRGQHLRQPHQLERALLERADRPHWRVEPRRWIESEPLCARNVEHRQGDRPAVASVHAEATQPRRGERQPRFAVSHKLEAGGDSASSASQANATI